MPKANSLPQSILMNTSRRFYGDVFSLKSQIQDQSSGQAKTSSLWLDSSSLRASLRTLHHACPLSHLLYKPSLPSQRAHSFQSVPPGSDAFASAGMKTGTMLFQPGRESVRNSSSFWERVLDLRLFFFFEGKIPQLSVSFPKRSLGLSFCCQRRKEWRPGWMNLLIQFGI